MTKEDLLAEAKEYFDNDLNRVEIFATEDRHFFNTEGDARYHCKDVKKYFQFTKNDFDADLVAKEKAKKAKLEAEELERQEELAMAEQIKKEDLLKKREDLIAPYSEFESKIELNLETSEGTFKKLLAELKKKEKEFKNKK